MDSYWHLPPTQVWPAAHALPQAPQSELDVWRSAHTPLQSNVPVGQAQLLLTHTRLAPHICAQKPQLSLSVARSTHAPMQLARPCPQLTLHVPWLHTSVRMQRLPHEPQLRGSLFGSVHVMPQTCSPDAHAHVPAVHVAPKAHWLPQEPQSRLLV
jgi:hypothetical protein